MALSFCALEKKTKLKEASKVPADNPSRYQYSEMPTESQPESQPPPAVVYITSIWKARRQIKRNTKDYVACTKLHTAQHWWQMRKQVSAFHNCRHPSLWGCVRLQVSDLDHGLSPEPSASQRDEGQREPCFPKANPGITAMVTSAETQKPCQFNWCKSVPLSHWNLTCTFQWVTLDNTHWWLCTTLILPQRSIIASSEHMMWCRISSFLVASHVVGGNFHRKAVVIFHISKY